jgi:hypothetical protein
MKEQNLQSHYRHRHGGVPIAIGMKVETKEGEGTTFIIYLHLS